MDAILALTTMTASGELAEPRAVAKQNKKDGQPYDVALGDAPEQVNWTGILGVEGEMTGDGRLIAPNALRWESLPLPLRYVAADSGAHDGAVVVGRINSITRGEHGLILAEGDFDTSGDAGIEAMRHVKENLTNGISLDLDDVSFEIRVASELLEDSDMPLMLMALDPKDDVPPLPEPDENGRIKVASINSDDEVRVTTDGRIRAATIVAIPAFASASIHMAGEEENASSDVTMAAKKKKDGACSCGTTDDNHAPDCALFEELAAEDEPVPSVTTGKLPDGSDCSCDEASPQFSPDCDCSVPSPPPNAPNSDVTLEEGEAAPMGLLPDGETPCSCDETDPAFDPDCVCAEEVEVEIEMVSPEDILLAAAVPLSPPAAWFSRPRFTQATALRVTPEGRVLGHLASWNTCHLSHTQQGQCVVAPKSPSGYAYFHTGTVMTAEGAEIPVGHITLDTRHANERLTPAATASHYEDTGTVVADVAAGEDEWGIWVSGALRPGVTPTQVRSLRSAPLSGDWRRIGAALELVAALAVNVPGFPIPRPSGLVAGGVVRTLVASGLVPPRTVRRPGTPGALSLDDLRYLKRLVARERAEEEALKASGSLPDATDLARRVRASAFAVRARRRPKA